MTDTETFLAWFHFQCRIPSDWETTSYSVEPRSGRLELSTRSGVQAVLGWEPCSEKPSAETLMVEFLRTRVPGVSAPSEILPEGLKTFSAGSFLAGIHGPELPCQALCFLPDEKILLRWVFTDSRPNKVERIYRPILESMQPNTGSWRRFSIFGCSFRLPENFLLEDMAVYPANVMLAFESKDKVRATFRRWGLPEHLLGNASLQSFYARILQGAGGQAEEIRECKFRGMDAVEVQYRQRGQYQMDMLMGRRWRNGAAMVWYDRNEKRIYAFEQIGPPQSALLDREQVLS